MPADDDDLLDIPPYLRRQAPVPRPPRKRPPQHPGALLKTPSGKPKPRATAAQVRALVRLGWRQATARAMDRELAAGRVRFNVKPWK